MSSRSILIALIVGAFVTLPAFAADEKAAAKDSSPKAADAKMKPHDHGVERAGSSASSAKPGPMRKKKPNHNHQEMHK